MAEVKLLISLIKSRGSSSMAGDEVISGLWNVPSAYPHLCMSFRCSIYDNS